MAKIKSVSGITIYVKDIETSVKFYETLGFDKRKDANGTTTIYSNWFWLNMVPISDEEKVGFAKEANAEPKGAGLFIYLSVDDVDQFYSEIVAAGLKPSTEPRDWDWGNREFVVRDPDGYKLVIFKKK
jgi:catechol 2,3-dioxygenase-like lactoylglutathione lyase family enzyme